MSKVNTVLVPVYLDGEYRGSVDIAYSGYGRQVEDLALPLVSCEESYAELNNICLEANQSNIVNDFGYLSIYFPSFTSPVHVTDAHYEPHIGDRLVHSITMSTKPLHIRDIRHIRPYFPRNIRYPTLEEAVEKEMDRICIKCKYPITSANNAPFHDTSSCEVCRDLMDFEKMKQQVIGDRNATLRQKLGLHSSVENNGLEKFLGLKEAREKRIRSYNDHSVAAEKERNRLQRTDSILSQTNVIARDKGLTAIDAYIGKLPDISRLHKEIGDTQSTYFRNPLAEADGTERLRLVAHTENVVRVLDKCRENILEERKIFLPSGNLDDPNTLKFRRELWESSTKLIIALSGERDSLRKLGHEDLDGAEEGRNKVDRTGLYYLQALEELWLLIKTGGIVDEDNVIGAREKADATKVVFAESCQAEEKIGEQAPSTYFTLQRATRMDFFQATHTYLESLIEMEMQRRSVKITCYLRLMDVMNETNSARKSYLSALNNEMKTHQELGKVISPETIEEINEKREAYEMSVEEETGVSVKMNGVYDLALSIFRSATTITYLVYTKTLVGVLSDLGMSSTEPDDLRFRCSDCCYSSLSIDPTVSTKIFGSCQDCGFRAVPIMDKKPVEICSRCRYPALSADLDKLRMSGINCRVCNAIEAVETAKAQVRRPFIFDEVPAERCTNCRYIKTNPTLPCKVCENYRFLLGEQKEAVKNFHCSLCALLKYQCILRVEKYLLGISKPCHSEDGSVILKVGSCKDCSTLHYLKKKKENELERIPCGICRYTRLLNEVTVMQENITDRNAKSYHTQTPSATESPSGTTVPTPSTTKSLPSTSDQLFTELERACGYIDCSECKYNYLLSMAQYEATSFVLYELPGNLYNSFRNTYGDVPRCNDCQYPIPHDVSHPESVNSAICKVCIYQGHIESHKDDATKAKETKLVYQKESCTLCTSRNQLLISKENAIQRVVTEVQKSMKLPDDSMELKVIRYLVLRYIAVEKVKEVIDDILMKRLQSDAIGKYYYTPDIKKDQCGNILYPVQRVDCGFQIQFNNSKLAVSNVKANLWKQFNLRFEGSKSVGYEYCFDAIKNEMEKQTLLQTLEDKYNEGNFSISTGKIGQYATEAIINILSTANTNGEYKTTIDRLSSIKHTCTYSFSWTLWDRLFRREEKATIFSQRSCKKCAALEKLIPSVWSNTLREKIPIFPFPAYLQHRAIHALWVVERMQDRSYVGMTNSTTLLGSIEAQRSKKTKEKSATVVLLDSHYVCTVEESRKEVRRFVELFGSLVHVKNAEIITYLSTLHKNAKNCNTLVEVSEKNDDQSRYLFLTSKFLTALESEVNNKLTEINKKTMWYGRTDESILSSVDRFFIALKKAVILLGLPYIIGDGVIALWLFLTNYARQKCSMSSNRKSKDSQGRSSLPTECRVVKAKGSQSLEVKEESVHGSQKDVHNNDTDRVAEGGQKEVQKNISDKKDEGQNRVLETPSDKKDGNETEQDLSFERRLYDLETMPRVARLKLLEAARNIFSCQYKEQCHQDKSLLRAINIYLWHLNLPGVTIQTKLRLIDKNMQTQLWVMHYIDTIDRITKFRELLFPVLAALAAWYISEFLSEDSRIEEAQLWGAVGATCALVILTWIYGWFVKQPIDDILAD